MFGRYEAMSKSYSTDESDEDKLPSLLGVFIPSEFFANTNEKSLGELLSETIALKDNIKSEKEKYKENIPLDDDVLPQEVVLKASPALSLEENEDPVHERLFGKLGTLRYFNVSDLSLWRCGYYCVPLEELSKMEKVLLLWSEEELLDAVGQAVKGISIGDVPNLNPIMHYILKLMSIHEDIATVNCCAQFIQKMLSLHPDVASISFSSAEVFMVLFNYGVDVQKNEIFQMFPSIEAIEVNLSCAHKLPVQWKYNLRTVLNCLADIFQYCKFNKDDLCNMLIYLLWMCTDSTLKASFIYQELQTCLCNVILSFTDQLWPICILFHYTGVRSLLVLPIIKVVCKLSSVNNVLQFYILHFRKCPFIMLSHISQILMAKGSLPVSKQWSYVLNMTRAIPYIICRGVQLRKQICFIALRHLSGDVPEDSPFGYPDESCVIAELQDLLKSICYIEQNLQTISFDFVGVLVTHLEFTSDEDYTSLCKSLKACDYVIRNSYNQLLSMNLQHQLMRIYSTLKLSSPKPHQIWTNLRNKRF